MVVNLARNTEEEGELPPRELQLHWWCERFSCLPEAGGLLDQDYFLISHMVVFSNIYQVMHKLHSLYGKQIHQLTGSDRMILRTLLDMGLLYGNDS